jgi:anti-sigma-K factor RskA
MDLEQQLRASLAAREPGADFESALMTRLAHRQTAALRRHVGWRLSAALAATVFAAAFGLNLYVAQQRQAHAHQQLLLALQITSYELNQVQHKLVPDETQENGT